LATKATIGKLILIIKKTEAADEWTDAEQSFTVAGNVVKHNYKAEVEVLAELFGYDNLLSWPNKDFCVLLTSFRYFTNYQL
jgi:hypothetical protein